MEKFKKFFNSGVLSVIILIAGHSVLFMQGHLRVFEFVLCNLLSLLIYVVYFQPTTVYVNINNNFADDDILESDLVELKKDN
jgi:hypothetical protein